MSRLVNRCKVLNKYFDQLSNTSSRLLKENIIKELKTEYPSIVTDLDYCFEVLAGKHKLGYTYIPDMSFSDYSSVFKDYTHRLPWGNCRPVL